VDGSGSSWNSSDLTVGNSGNGTLNITGGGAVSTYSADIGYESGATGVVAVDGPGSTWNSSYDLTVGRSGNGTLTCSYRSRGDWPVSEWVRWW
jgi:T5SS/PEP-CTERM-associated repeat protein